MTSDDLDKAAIDEILKESKRAAIRAAEFGISGWRKPPIGQVNRRFLVNTVSSTIRSRVHDIVAPRLTETGYAPSADLANGSQPDVPAVLVSASGTTCSLAEGRTEKAKALSGPHLQGESTTNALGDASLDASCRVASDIISGDHNDGDIVLSSRLLLHPPAVSACAVSTPAVLTDAESVSCPAEQQQSHSSSASRSELVPSPLRLEKPEESVSPVSQLTKKHRLDALCNAVNKKRKLIRATSADGARNGCGAGP